MLFIRRALMVTVLAVLLLPVHVVSAATFAGHNGRIAHNKANGGLWWARHTGGQAEQLSTSHAQDMAWSPDGTRVAFTELRPNGTSRLRIMNITTGATQNSVDQSDSSESSPAWSYDGTRVAFVRTKQERGNTLSGVFTIKAAGDDVKNISGWSVGKTYSVPSWAPDNKRLAYQETNKDSARILIKDLPSGKVRELTKLSDTTGSPLVEWSPSGQKILFNDSKGQVYTIWADGTRRTVISDGDSYAASWSPDGKRIAFLEDFNGGSVSISEADGTIRYIALNLKGYDRINNPVWSPNAKQLIFVATQDSSPKHDLFSIGVSGTAQPVRVVTGVTEVIAWQVLARRTY